MAETIKWEWSKQQDGGYGLSAHTEGKLLFQAQKPVVLIYAQDGKLIRQEFPVQSVDGGNGHLDITDSLGNQWTGTLSISPRSDGTLAGSLALELRQGEARGVFIGLCLQPHMLLKDTYMCFPGYVYDSNNWDERVKYIPRVCDEQDNKLFIPTFSTSMPAGAFMNRSAGLLAYFATEQNVDGYDTSFYCDCNDDQIKVTAIVPMYRERQYKLATYDGVMRFGFQYDTPVGANLTVGESLTLPFYLAGGECQGIPGMFDDLLNLRRLWRKPHTHRLPFSRARELVEDNFNEHHWTDDFYYANAAMIGVKDEHPQLMTGWCAGIMTGYGMLSSQNPICRERAATMIDWLCANGMSPSGFFYGCYQDGAWIDEPFDPRKDKGLWQHIRLIGDSIFYLFQSYMSEKRSGVERANWRDALKTNLDALCLLFENNGEFGLYVDRKDATILDGNCGAGALCIACLARGYGLFGDERYLRVAEAAGDYYYTNFLGRGHTNAGPLDILCAADSESAAMYPEAYISLYEVTGKQTHLNYAREAAALFASWTLCYNGVFPKDSVLDKLKVETAGAVIASVQNHHLGPGAATHSMEALLRIYRHTRDERYLRVLEDIAGGLPQWISQYDGHIDRMLKGMVPEQFNLNDEMNHDRGGLWNISVSWGATNILLAQGDLPGVYADLANRKVAVFDHVCAGLLPGTDTLALHNTTDFPMEFRVVCDRCACTCEPSMEQTVSLNPGQKLELKL